MQLFNNSVEKPQTSILPDHQNSKFDSRIFRNGLRAFALSIVMMTTSCGQQPKESQVNQYSTSQSKQDQARAEQERLDEQVKDEESKNRIEDEKRKSIELTRELENIDKKIRSMMTMCRTYNIGGTTYYRSDEDMLRFRFLTKEILNKRQELIGKSGNYDIRRSPQFYYYDDHDHSFGIDCLKMSDQNKINPNKL
jgi:hypothetical protein